MAKYNLAHNYLMQQSAEMWPIATDVAWSVCMSVYRKVGSQWALEMAKYNLAHNYLVVGLTDQLEEFVAVLEAGLPRFFSGALEFFSTGLQ